MEGLRTALGAFIEERDWEQFHSPKNLAMALSVEAAEIVEHFQWLTEEQSKNLPPTVSAATRFLGAAGTNRGVSARTRSCFKRPL